MARVAEAAFPQAEALRKAGRFAEAALIAGSHKGWAAGT